LKRLFVFMTAGLLALGAGCTTPSLKLKDPFAITSEKMSGVGKGVSRIEIKMLFGEPEMIARSSKGETHFYKDLNLNSLWIVFDGDGTVKSYKWSD